VESAEVKYLSVKDYDRFQHYKDRSPVWIKLYNSVMDNEEFLSLSDAERGQLMLIWLLASRRDNRIPHDNKAIARAIQASGRVQVERFIETGFLVPYQDASAALAEPEQDSSPHARPSARGEGEREAEAEKRETEQSGARPVAQVAEEAFRAQMGEHLEPVLRFLDARPANARSNWFPEMLKIIGPSTGVLPEDLAGACSDALLVDPPASTPVALRAFATRRKVERLKQSIPAPVIRSIGPATASGDAAIEDEALWSHCQEVVGKLRRRQMPSAEFNALPEALRAGLKAIGGWQAVNEAKPGSLPFLRRDFLAAYHATNSRVGAA
jgi:hypothetical protein